jgi:hypothetical protein
VRCRNATAANLGDPVEYRWNIRKVYLLRLLDCPFSIDHFEQIATRGHLPPCATCDFMQTSRRLSGNDLAQIKIPLFHLECTNGTIADTRSILAIRLFVSKFTREETIEIFVEADFETLPDAASAVRYNQRSAPAV